MASGDWRALYPQRRHARLDPLLYSQPGRICSITIATKARQPVFSIPEVARLAVDTLTAHAATTMVRVYAYCVMPDHVHLIVAPSESCDLITFIGQFKNLTQRAAWRLGVEGAFWQQGFWDHLLREDEDLELVVRYVLDNPVKAGLADDWQTYGYAGSLVWQLEP